MRNNAAESSIVGMTYQQENNPQTEPTKFTKRIGSTNFIVSVYHSQTSKETVEDKLLRLIKS